MKYDKKSFTMLLLGRKSASFYLFFERGTINENEKDINIYYEDNRHQNEYGAYLSAACHVRSMFNIDVTKSTEYCGLDEAKCKTLLEVAKNIG